MGIEAVLKLVAGMIPIINALVATIASIKAQTEASHPEVWAKVRDDWKGAVNEWNETIGK